MESEKLIHEARKLESEYHREWRAKNKEKVKKINQRYWINKAKKELEKKGEESNGKHSI